MSLAPTSWKEARRLLAWQLKQQGWSQRQIAEALGVSEAAVSQWMKRVRVGGPEALRHRTTPGAPRRLSAEQLARPPKCLQRGAEAYGFRGQVWTRSRIEVELRNMCCFNLPHLRVELRNAVKRVRRKPHLIQAFFRGAQL